MSPITTRAFVGIAFFLLSLPAYVRAAGGTEHSCTADLTRHIPARPADAPAGSAFAMRIAETDSREREADIRRAILSGNLPSFLRRLKPVSLTARLPSGRKVRASICVMPDYLAVGTDRDFFRVPMNLATASDIAASFGFVLPTPKMVDAIYQQSDANLEPQPMQAGPRMRSTTYYLRHNLRIEAQRDAYGIPLGALIAGHKKDVVMSRRLAARLNRVAIYGWHRRDGRPIQPLSTVHGMNYADYSHGIRLVSDVMYLEGEPISVHAVLADHELAAILSSEGPVEILSRYIPKPLPRMAGSRPI